jgi:hypothetical protein
MPKRANTSDTQPPPYSSVSDFYPELSVSTAMHSRSGYGFLPEPWTSIDPQSTSTAWNASTLTGKHMSVRKTVEPGFAHGRFLSRWETRKTRIDQVIFLHEIYTTIPQAGRDDFKTQKNFTELQLALLDDNNASNVTALLKFLRHTEACFAVQGWWYLPHKTIEELVKKAFENRSEETGVISSRTLVEDDLPEVLRRKNAS